MINMNKQDAKILLVDDEELMVQGLNRILRIHGYRPLFTTKPKEAIELMESNDISVLICDQRMPDMSGNKVLQHAKEHCPHMVRILLTGYSDMKSTIEAINSGLIFRYLAKPVDEEELVQAIQDAFLQRDEKIKQEIILNNYTLEQESWQKTLEELNSAIGNHKNGAMNALLRTLEVKDPELYNHSKRVEKQCKSLAEKYDYSQERIDNLCLAGLFHDLGKLTVRDHILYKEGPLDSEAFDLMKEHVTFGAEIIKELGFIDKVADIVLEHHERMDGSGYPYGKKGDEISHEARILAIVDIYDALISERVYRKAMTKDQAMAVLREEAETKLDRSIVDAFETIL